MRSFLLYPVLMTCIAGFTRPVFAESTELCQDHLGTFGEHKYALLVGIEKYERPEIPALARFEDLPDAPNNLDIMYKTLRQAHFDVVCLRDNEATQEQITAALERLRISIQEAARDTAQNTQPSKPAPVALFYFSGHGQQLLDDDGDESFTVFPKLYSSEEIAKKLQHTQEHPADFRNSFDTLDESIVPYDYVAKNNEHHRLRDDAINFYASRLLHDTPNVWMIFDSCHSGSIYRSTQTDKPIQPDLHAFLPKQMTLAAAMSDQYSYPSKLPNPYAPETMATYGNLTWALVKTLQEAPTDISFGTLHQLVQQKLQTITAEDHNRTHTAVLAGDPQRILFLQKPDYTTTRSYLWSYDAPKKQLLLHAGAVDQLPIFAGSLANNSKTTISVLFTDTQTNTQITGYIESVSAYQSRIVLTDDLQKSLESHQISPWARVFLPIPDMIEHKNITKTMIDPTEKSSLSASTFCKNAGTARVKITNNSDQDWYVDGYLHQENQVSTEQIFTEQIFTEQNERLDMLIQQDFMIPRGQTRELPYSFLNDPPQNTNINPADSQPYLTLYACPRSLLTNQPANLPNPAQQTDLTHTAGLPTGRACSFDEIKALHLSLPAHTFCQ